MESSRRSFIKKSAIGAAGLTIGGMGMTAKSYGGILAPTTKSGLGYSVFPTVSKVLWEKPS